MEIVYAVTTAVVPLAGGGQILVRAGEHWPAEDPIVQAQPSLFSTDPSNGLRYSSPPPVVEQATAAPGEKRQVRRG